MNHHLIHCMGSVASVCLLAAPQLHAQALESQLHQAAPTTGLAPAIEPLPVLTAMQRVADWQLAHPSTLAPTDWVQATADAGFMALAGISGDPKYREAMRALGRTNQWQLGRELYDADAHCIGQTWAELYLLYREDEMIAPLREKFDAVLANPTTVQSLAYGRASARDNWSWCDSLFMGPPAWVRLYAATGDERYLNFAVTNWWRTSDFLYDQQEHLFFRDNTYFSKREANGKKIFWSRGNGWVMAGLVRTLQYLPMNHPDRARFERLFKAMAEKILACQQPDGLWRASLLDPDSYPAKETSGSGFYTYALAWGVNQGLLDRAKFEPAVRKAWVALVGCVDADGKLTHVQPGGSDPRKFNDDNTAPFGVGAFLLAGSEVYRMAVLETLPANAEAVVPVIQMQDVPLTDAIAALARQAGINYLLDPATGLGQSGETGAAKAPVIRIGWTNVTARHALQSLLANSRLQAAQNPDTKVFSITRQSTNLPAGTSPLDVFAPVVVSVKNPSLFRRDEETVELHCGTTAKGLGVTPAGGRLAVMDAVSSRILDSQAYSEGSEDKLLFQVDLAPGETRTYTILDASALAAGPPPIMKTFARYVPERHDDFAWESDRVAHRVFGKALETWQAEPLTSSGIDVWIKRTRDLIVDQMYRTAVYFDTNGPAQDDYRVSKTRGCGGLGVWDGTNLYVSANWRQYRMLTTGPIRSEFELTYDAWDAGGRKISEIKRISIDAGANLSRIASTFSSDDTSPLTIAVGLAERPGENVFLDSRTNPWPAIDSWPNSTAKGLVVQNRKEGWMAYWQPQDFNKGTTGVAIILPKGSVETFTNDRPDLAPGLMTPRIHTETEGASAIRNLLAIAPAKIGVPFVYYAGAGWSESGDFPNAAAWDRYVQRFAERRDQPLEVTIGK